MKILCLFVRHGTEKYPEALTVLDQWYERHGLRGQRTLWIIDNALDPMRCPATSPTGERLLPGDNRAWEFSAWDTALAQMMAGAVRYDIIHFVTSAFNTLYTGYLNHFSREMLDYALARNVCVGHIDSHRQPMQLEEFLSASWVRTCFFFLPESAICRGKPWAAYSDPSKFFTSPQSREFRIDAPLSPAYQTHITAWLEGQKIGWHTWHSPVVAGGDENVRFQRKTLAILNEHRLSITLRQAGIKLADFCWLFSLRHTPWPAVMDPPEEHEQLVIRRRILGFQE